MMLTSGTLRSYRRALLETGRIAFRHILLPINAIIFAVVGLLALFGQTQEGLFLGSIVTLNIALGFGQDVRAWLMLENLQILTALRITRIEQDDTERKVTVEELQRGDRIRLRLGDQMPCDGVVLEGTSIEVNEGLITGESHSISRNVGDGILAGNIVTSGAGIVRIDTSFSESRVAQMARGLKRYSANPSPIQRSIETVIRYTVFALLAVTALIVTRGILTHESHIHIVENIGALASILVPQGLVVSTTLLFTYGAGHFFRRNVLLQEVNATEKFGRIKNLCMDKTGTLTENTLTAERICLDPSGSVPEDEARRLASLYVRHSGDSSQSIRALGTFLKPPPEARITDVLSFSSWRSYGGIAIADNGRSTVVLMGAPEVFAPHLGDEEQRSWLNEFSGTQARAGKHLLCLVRCAGTSVPRALAGSELSLVAVFVFNNKLRDGVRGAVDFFQNRGVVIRILSGDHPATVHMVAAACGIKDTDALITSDEMLSWDAADYARKAKQYVLFARIQPEQKERIIEALKLDGFTAMVGDGANDALSVKKADLGIAMFEGATATRQIAAVVLMHNSFVELPAGVRLADSMIENIEIFASVFFDQTLLAFLFFAALTLLGFDFPLTPLNVTFINYFTVGIPALLIAYWAINPTARTLPASERPFLRRVVPLPVVLSFLQAAAVIAVFIVGNAYLPGSAVRTLLILEFVALGLIYLPLAAGIQSDGDRPARWLGILVLSAVEAIFLFFAFKIPFVLTFFALTPPSLENILSVLSIAALCGVAQYAVVKIFFSKSAESSR